MSCEVAKYAADTSSTISASEIADVLTSDYKGLLALVRLKTKDRELASDLLNEAVLLTLQHVKEGRVRTFDQIGGYVFTITMNLLRNHQRTFANRKDIRADVQRLDSLAVHDADPIELAQLGEKARRMIEALPTPRDREVVRRFYLEEQDKQTICNDLQLTSQQFSQVVSRARKRIKESFLAKGLQRNDVLTF